MGFQGIGNLEGPGQPDSLRRDNNARPGAAANAWHLRRNGFIFMGGAPADVRARVRDAKCISTPRARLSITGGAEWAD